MGKMTSNIEKFGENSNKILNAMIKSNVKFMNNIDIETETGFSNDKVQDALGWLIKANKVSAVKDADNKIRYVLVDGTYEKDASVIWQSLKLNGPQNITQLEKTTKLSEGEIHGAIGWLAREGDIDFTAKGSIRKYFVL
jgi:hypothetical protein